MISVFGFSAISLCSGGVPSDLLGARNLTVSPDFGLYSQCELPRGSGQLSGICVPPSYTADILPFCGEFVSYAACVPPTSSIPAWASWHAAAKDTLIAGMYNSIVAERIAAEAVSVNDDSLPYVEIRFTENAECILNFKKALCVYNFPECIFAPISLSDKTANIWLTVRDILPICRSDCEEYFSTCKFDSAMTSKLCGADSVWPIDNVGKLNRTSLLINRC